MVRKEIGWVPIHRKTLDNPFCRGSAERIGFWLILLLLANHETTSFYVGTSKITLNPGQFITGRKILSEKTGVSQTSCERYLTCLESEQQIGQQKNNKYRIITILNWSKYKKLDSTLDNRRTTDGQQTDTYNNDNNDNKIVFNNTIRKSKDLRVDAIIEMFKTKFNKMPVDRKPRYIAYTFSKAIRTFISKVEDVRPDLTYDVMVEKAFGYYISKYPDIQPEYIDTVYRYAKQLFAAQLLKINSTNL